MTRFLRFGAGAASAALTVVFEVLFNPAPLGEPGVDDFRDPSCDPKCGDCDPAEKGFLQSAVNEACKSGRNPRCNPGMSPEQREAAFWAHLQCMFARMEINDRCFLGCDKGHRQAVDDARLGALRCLDFMTAPP